MPQHPATSTPTAAADAGDTGTDAGSEQIVQQVAAAAAAASSKKATDVVGLAVGPLVGITDHFLLLSTANDRQLAAVVDEVEARLRVDHGRKPIGREGAPASGWVVLDYGDYVIHGFTAAQRAVYDLERLWGDAPRTAYEDVDAPA